MRYNLSSKIALTHTPESLYRPSNAFEHRLLTIREKMPTTICESVSEASEQIARQVAESIRQHYAQGRHFTLGIVGGNSPSSILKELIRLHTEEGLSFANVYLFIAYEFYPLHSEHSGCVSLLQEEFVRHIDIPSDHVISFNGQVGKEEINEECMAYHQKLESLGGFDLVLLGVGALGTIAMNLPGTMPNSGIRLMIMDRASRNEALATFSNIEDVPTAVITIGMREIMAAHRVLLFAWGEHKANILQKVVEEPATEALPASLLQHHNNVQVYADLQSAALLTRINHPWLVTTCIWDSKLIRRAIVWLCMRTGKPILKLTNKDYSDNHLGELLATYGSAYEVNIKVFNDMQHTITGWPGGKPNADDSNRPERAQPHPKRVLVFSPHPDDDVISMGGTFRRLVVQGHDVHVAYQTSGNIAVGDEEVVRYLSYLSNVCEELGMEDSPMMGHAQKMKHYLLYEKQEGMVELPEVRFMKGTIRREEARTACRFVGLKDDHVHFLDLPFYETGTIKKGDLTDVDIHIIIDLLRQIKPHQIFVAGDLADPHGTHKVCLDAVLAAIDVIKSEDWFADCWIWMYRGAWAEWEIDHIEMAVPMSPEELRFKRNSILKHQSQMESAPFLGSDERLFWQRAEDRNRATAQLYDHLGLASYEAIEAFVRYHPIN
ncbi:glucosamine-6-phosphate deaminase [Porphyromonas sp.]|uniref:glucosamine-6-phosphate deaminase n=1 Tax=Porphyromonas sp. TaxID=1924944 RepID=UPI0026DDAFBE|nr:glucosamine-6-phosphate deaminase [Porphyromonas sp.]MDO4771467.1 glucosamine-6-phosphate deaminase [Porphyromonas sp.]